MDSTVQLQRLPHSMLPMLNDACPGDGRPNPPFRARARRTEHPSQRTQRLRHQLAHCSHPHVTNALLAGQHENLDNYRG